MWTDNVGVELLASLPFKHDIRPKGRSPYSTKSGSETPPPTLLLVYNFIPRRRASLRGSRYQPYFFLQRKGNRRAQCPGLADDISLDSSTGLALEVGVDADINKDWFFQRLAVAMDIDTKATLKGGAWMAPRWT